MATLRDIKARIVGVKNTQQITKAMKMVAAARLRRAQENIINARPYSRKIHEVLNNLLKIEKDYQHPFLEVRPVNNVSIVVVTSDRGLCGGFNSNIIKAAEDEITKNFSEVQNCYLHCVGKKGYDYFSKREFKLGESFPGAFSNLEFEFASSLAKMLASRFLSGEVDRIVLIYNEFKSVVQQVVTVKQLFPLEAVPSDDDSAGNISDFIYEPDKASIISSLLPRVINSRIWTVLLESYAAELGARMTAMDLATENAKEMIRSLQITYNKERQASITSEILEIVSGANALKNA
jgi:F-type H+-transporting ATPase subunit gamma